MEPAWIYGRPGTDTSGSIRNALTAAAQPMNEQTSGRRTKANRNSRDVEVWAIYDQVGELHYVSNAISGRTAQAELYVQQNDKRLKSDKILEKITPQIVERLALNLYVAGEAFLLGVPSDNGKDTEFYAASKHEVSSKDNSAKEIEFRGKKYDRKTIFFIRIWDPHPAYWERPDSPVLAALPILRELVGMTQSVGAQIDSRLAGAGVMWIPQTILKNPTVPSDQGQQFDDNPVLNAIMNAMLAPIEDRSNASAVVPLLLGAPDDAIEKIKYMTFATPFDGETKELRDEAIRRLALSLDAPPELLLGLGDSSHWNAWIVREDVVQTHIVPRLELITDALTREFYRPLLKAQNPKANVEEYEILSDVSQLIQRPNRLEDASVLHEAGVLNDESFLEAGGYTDQEGTDRAVELTVKVCSQYPQLLDNMPEVEAAFRSVLGTEKTKSAQVSRLIGPPQRIPDDQGNQVVEQNVESGVPNAGLRPAL